MYSPQMQMRRDVMYAVRGFDELCMVESLVSEACRGPRMTESLCGALPLAKAGPTAVFVSFLQSGNLVIPWL